MPHSLEPAAQTRGHEKSPRLTPRAFNGGGERGIRTPGGVTLNGFQDRRIRPLCHLSAAKVVQFFFSAQRVFYPLTVIIVGHPVID